MGQCVAGRTGKGRTARTLRNTFAGLGLYPARTDEFSAIHRLGSGLIGAGVASEDALRTVHRRQRCGFYVTREGGRVTGAMALVLLNQAGLEAVCTDRFDANHPDPGHEILPGEAPVAVYGWGIAAENRNAAGSIVASCRALRDILPVPFFLRAATGAGRRLFAGKMEFTPYRGSTTGLLWWDGCGRQARRAA